jgi:predicted branched-subunit amino acid permease
MSDLPAPFTLAGVRRGAIQAQSMAPGVAVYGALFGALAHDTGLSLLTANLMSLLVFSGSAQMAALQGIASGAASLAIVAAVATINARYLLYSATLRPWLGEQPGWKVFPTLFVTGDGSWIMSMKAHAAGERDAGFLFGSGVAMLLPWLGGSLVGYLAGGLIRDPARFGFDFMLVAFAAAMGAGMFRGRGDVLPAVAAGLSALLLFPRVGAGWTMVLAGVAGGLAAALAWREEAGDGR